MRLNKHPRQDPVTKEWFFNGKWYDRYPGKEIKDRQDMIDEYWEQKFDEARDTIGDKWHGGM